MNWSKHRICRLPTAFAVLLMLVGSIASAETTQQRVHEKAHTVMPFAMSKTLHIFRMTETGGVEKVIARDPNDTDQIALIRRHLEREAKRFQRGNYSDPARLHGADMPGLKELEAGAAHITVSYSQRPAGAAITFETTDLHLLTSIHRWFGAQLSEHGADARAE